MKPPEQVKWELTLQEASDCIEIAGMVRDAVRHCLPSDIQG